MIWCEIRPGHELDRFCMIHNFKWHSQLLKWIWKHSPTEHFYTAVILLQFKLPTQYCKWEQTGANESDIQMAPTSCQWEDVIGEQPPVMLPLILSWPVTGWPIKSLSERWVQRYKAKVFLRVRGRLGRENTSYPWGAIIHFLLPDAWACFN